VRVRVSPTQHRLGGVVERELVGEHAFRQVVLQRLARLREQLVVVQVERLG
jgi:hypothetical protein